MSQSTRKTHKGLLYIEHLKLLKCYQSLIQCILMIRFPQHTLGFPYGSDGKESTCSARDPGSIPGSWRIPGEGNGYPLQCTCLENSMDRGVWQATILGITKESDMTEQLKLHFGAFQVALVVKNSSFNANDIRDADSISVLGIPWRRLWQPTSVFLPGESPWTEEPVWLQFIGLHTVGHDWSNLACMNAYHA